MPPQGLLEWTAFTIYMEMFCASFIVVGTWFQFPQGFRKHIKLPGLYLWLQCEKGFWLRCLLTFKLKSVGVSGLKAVAGSPQCAPAVLNCSLFTDGWVPRLLRLIKDELWTGKRRYIYSSNFVIICIYQSRFNVSYIEWEWVLLRLVGTCNSCSFLKNKITF